MIEHVTQTSGDGLAKAPTGITGLDEITGGGLPRGRATMVLGNAGCGKTLLGMEFLLRGASEFDEPGVFVAFEETPDDLAENVRSLGWDLRSLAAENRLLLEHIQVNPEEIIETGEYNLEGLFVRLSAALDSIGARRLVLDTVETLFAGFANGDLLRAEIRRLIVWLKDRGITTVFTGELGRDGLTRHGVEEYVSDCVIRLDHRIVNQISTRRIQVAKYRGSRHGTNEYPFIIGEHGFEIFPITSLGLEAPALDERISTGISRLDELFGGVGPHRGSSVLIAGTAGTGKTSVAAHFAEASCARGEAVLYLSFEESPTQILRNMASIGLELERRQQQKLLTLIATRPSAFGLETHLTHILGLVSKLNPKMVILDPISHMSPSRVALEQSAVLMRVLDELKCQGVTAVLTDLCHAGEPPETTSSFVSSQIDSWLVLRDVERAGERSRIMYLVKSRGTAHSHQLREYRLSENGFDILEPWTGPSGALHGNIRQ